MVNTKNEVSVIICTYNAGKSIADTLKSVFKSSYKNLEVIVIDDASTDNTLDLCKSFPIKIIKLEKNRGPAFSRNVGVRSAKGKIIIFLDSDVIFPPDLFNNMLAYMENQPDIAGVGTISSPFPLNPGFYSRYFALQENQKITQLFGKERCVYSNFVCTRCGCLKNSVFEEIGGFNENYKTPSIEDYDFSMRMKDKYRILYDKALVIDHHFPDTFFKIFKRYYKNSNEIFQILGFNKIEVKGLFEKDICAWSLIIVSGMLFISGIFWHIFFYASFIAFLVATAIKKELLKTFYKSEGLYFMIRGWTFYCLCSMPIIVGFINGFLKNIKQQFIQSFKSNVYRIS